MVLDAKQQRFLRDYNELKTSGKGTNAAQDSTYKLLTGNTYKPQPVAKPAPVVNTPKPTNLLMTGTAPKPQTQLNTGNQPVITNYGTTSAPKPAVTYAPSSQLNEKENRFMRDYAALTNPSAAQKQTFMTLSAKLDKPTFANEKDERYFRQMNPNHAYTKDKEMRFLNQIDGMLVNNQGVSAAQMKQYDSLAGKWNFDPTKGRVTSEVTKQVEAEIAAKKKAIEDELAMAIQASQLAVNQNNAYLQEQIANLTKQKAVVDNQAAQIQNRRGGYYSGGLDYQLGQNASSFNEQSGYMSREIAMRNADIQGKNALIAQQAAEQIGMLQQQAPDLIRQRINEELDRQRGIKMQEAALTGQYNGAPTLEAKLAEQQRQQWEIETKNDQYWKNQGQKNWEQEFNKKWDYQSARDAIEDDRFKQQFDEDVRRYGLDYALQKQVQLGNLNLDQKQYNIDKQKWDIEQELLKQPEAADLAKYTGQLNKTYLQKELDGSYTVKNAEGLYRSIIGLNLSDEDTMRLMSMYGIDMGFLGE